MVGDVPEPGRGDRVASSSWRPGRTCGTPTRCCESLEPDAEALVVNRISEPPQYVIAPIDECYALVGAVKASWEGISGGDAVERAVPTFFERLPSAPRAMASGEGDRRRGAGIAPARSRPTRGARRPETSVEPASRASRSR